jgi:hypothetical protein
MAQDERDSVEQFVAVINFLNTRGRSVAPAESTSLVGRCKYEGHAASRKSVGRSEIRW